MKGEHIRRCSMNVKNRKWIFFACLLLTVVVLHTCIRIEVLNARYNHFLPRTDAGNGNPRWRCAASSLLLRSLERDIANDRYRRFMQAHPNEPGSDPDQFLGPPYSVAETTFIDAEMAENDLRASLLGWVSSFGLLQYILAPLAFCSSLASLYFNHNVIIRLVAGSCTVSILVAVGFMIYRGYFTSLGW